MVIFDQFINSLLSPIQVRPASVYKAAVSSGRVGKRGAIKHKICVNDRPDHSSSANQSSDDRQFPTEPSADINSNLVNLIKSFFFLFKNDSFTNKITLKVTISHPGYI